jgi:Flp pilus assembly protein TadG
MFSKSYRKRQDGVVAIEFAMLGIPFFMLLMGLVETSLFFASGAVLEGGAQDAARVIRTGEVQTSADPEQTFRDELCNSVDIMMDCNLLQYDVFRVEPNTFAGAVNLEAEFDESGNLIPQGFSTGNSNDVVIVRAVYRYKFFTPFIGALMTGDPNVDWVNHMSTVVIKAEPYNFGEI